MPEDVATNVTAWMRLRAWWRGHLAASHYAGATPSAQGNGGNQNVEQDVERNFNQSDEQELERNGAHTSGTGPDLVMTPTVGAGFHDPGRRLGCVLVHGLSSTPESMRGLGRALADGGIDVEGVCLPGHGTRPEDLEGVEWSAWVEAVRDTVHGMRARCDRVFVCGQSLGGTLALHVAANDSVDGVITLAAVLHLRDWRLWLLPVLKHVMRWRHSPGNDIAKPGTRDEGSYLRMPLSAVHQLVALAGLVRDELPRIRVPALIMHGTEDHVAPVSNASEIYARIGSEHKEILRLRRSYHVISLDNDFELVVDRCLRFLRNVGFASTPAS